MGAQLKLNTKCTNNHATPKLQHTDFNTALNPKSLPVHPFREKIINIPFSAGEENVLL